MYHYVAYICRKNLAFVYAKEKCLQSFMRREKIYNWLECAKKRKNVTKNFYEMLIFVFFSYTRNIFKYKSMSGIAFQENIWESRNWKKIFSQYNLYIDESIYLHSKILFLSIMAPKPSLVTIPSVGCRRSVIVVWYLWLLYDTHCI